MLHGSPGIHFNSHLSGDQLTSLLLRQHTPGESHQKVNKGSRSMHSELEKSLDSYVFHVRSSGGPMLYAFLILLLAGNTKGKVYQFCPFPSFSTKEQQKVHKFRLCQNGARDQIKRMYGGEMQEKSGPAHFLGSRKATTISPPGNNNVCF